jgi:predicted ATPase
MRIVSFLIQNFRNLRRAECTDVPDMMIVCGGNGCGKSSLLEALMTAKEHAGAYGHFRFDPKSVSADAEKATIKVVVSFSDLEREFVKTTYNQECPEEDEIEIEILKGGSGRVLKRSGPTHQLFTYYSTAKGSPGFFDYITAHRQTQKQELANWDASFLSDDRAKQTLAGTQNKFQQTKQYLAGLKMRDLQELQRSLISGTEKASDSLADIRETFDRFFAPLKFKDVFLDRSPFGFVIETPSGEIDIDDLSSGEKEIFNIFVRFHQLKPQAAVILFDEADAHLHPDLERRYLRELKRVAEGNQIILTTHSPEMMIEAGSESLFTIHRRQTSSDDNQLRRVTPSDNLHGVLSELMGTRGLISFNQRVVFIEGEEASADREIYEALFPPSEYNISFVPAGNSSTVRKTAERVNALLTSAISFQNYFCIVDKDIERGEDDPTGGSRIFRLPVYHVENFLLDEELIFCITQQMLGSKCPYSSKEEVTLELERLVLMDQHLLPYSKAVLDAEIAKVAKQAHDAVWKRQFGVVKIEVPGFDETKEKCKTALTAAIAEGTWRNDVKGRDLLKAYCSRVQLKYEHFRNSVIASLPAPPAALMEIIAKIDAQAARERGPTC